MSDNRPASYTEGDITIYRASSVGKCLTALVASKTGHTPARGEFQQGVLTSAAKEGNLHEDAIIETLKAEHKWRVWGGQDEMEMTVIPRVIIRGHIDGICLPPRARKERLLEIKTMSSDRFKKWLKAGSTVRARLMSPEFETYAWQISAYMHHYGMTAMYVVKDRNSGKLDIGELKVPPIDMKTIRKKIIQAEKWALKDELPPCQATSGEKFFCEFPYLHDLDSPFGDEPDDDDPVFDSATEALIAGMAENYVELAKQTAHLRGLEEERKDLGQRMIQAGLNNPKVKDYRAGRFDIKRSDSNSRSLNKDALASELGISREKLDAAMDKATTKTPYSYVTVKENT